MAKLLFKICFMCMCIPAMAQAPAGDALSSSEKVWTLSECLDYAMEHNIQLKQTRNTYLSGVEDTKQTLSECLDYAMEHNIQLKQTRNTYLSGVEDTKQARAALFPSLSASTSQSLANYPSSDVTDNNMYTGSYNLNASMSLFRGGSLSTALKQQKVQNEMDLLSVEETANDIRVDQPGGFCPARESVEERRVPGRLGTGLIRRIPPAAQATAGTRYHGRNESCLA